jgi:Na+/melibiose symporter-like transporter
MTGGITAASGIFFFTTVKAVNLAQFAQFTLVLFIAGVLSAPIWAIVAKRIGKHIAMMLAAGCHFMFMMITYFIPAGAYEAFLASALLGGIAFSGAAMLPPAMLADVADEEELDNGIDRTGLLFALMTGIFKIGQAVSVGIVFGALDLIGFEPKLGAANDPAALEGVAIIYSFFSAAFAGAAILLMLGYKLTAERSGQIRAELEKRRALAHAPPPDGHPGVEAETFRAEFHP